MNNKHVDKLSEGVDSWNRWRKENPEIMPELSLAEFNLKNLSGINLNHADLSRANLSRANLINATFLNAKLNRADFLNAKLSRADFFGANLSNANLSGTDLRGAKLSHTELISANLTRAILIDTDFNQAKLGVTTFANVDLSHARNLKTVRCQGPSTIGLDTLYQSLGKIPDEFLRGCGVPEEFVVYGHSLAGKLNKFYSCFISYSHSDESFALRLYDALQNRGIRCWLDTHQLLPGDDIYDKADQGIRTWDKVLLCASKSSLTSWWVDSEITAAFEKESLLWRERGKKIYKLITLNLDNYLFSGEWKSGKAPTIKSRLAANFTGWEEDEWGFENQLELVVKALSLELNDMSPEPKL